MKRSLQISIAIAVMFVGLACADAFAWQNVRKPAASGGVTGTYTYVLNTLEVLELPDKKVRIKFVGFWPNDRKRVETRNSGAFDETVALDGKTATVKIKFGEEPCTVTMEFRPNKVIVEQGGSLMGCGFGFNVEPDGTYVKVSSKPPRMPRQ
jgi:hypothetical protein